MYVSRKHWSTGWAELHHPKGGGGFEAPCSELCEEAKVRTEVSSYIRYIPVRYCKSENLQSPPRYKVGVRFLDFWLYPTSFISIAECTALQKL